MTDKPDGMGLTVDMVLRSEWAVINMTDKEFFAWFAAPAFGNACQALYTVPANKRLYLTWLVFGMRATNAADAELNQMCTGAIYHYLPLPADYRWFQGGNGGGGSTFPKPLIIEPGEKVGIWCVNRSNHDGYVYVSAGGYELPV